MIVRIRPTFFLLCLLIGLMLETSSAIVTALMVLLVFGIHELGHVVALSLLGRKATVLFSGVGGKTQSSRPFRHFWQRMLAQSGGLFATAIIALILNGYIIIGGQNEALLILFVLNFVWFWINLFPLYPYDMGEIVVDMLQTVFGPFGRRIGAIISLFLSVFLFIVSLLFRQFVLAFFFLYSSIKSWKLLMHPYTSTSSEPLSEGERRLYELLMLYEEKKQEEAIIGLQELALKNDEIKVRQSAVEACARFFLETDRPREAFQMLFQAKDPLPFTSLEHFQLAAYRTSHWREGLEIGERMFRERQTLSVAVFSAVFSARLGRVTETKGWLIAIQRLGGIHVQDLLEAHDFDRVRHNIEKMA